MQKAVPARVMLPTALLLPLLLQVCVLQLCWLAPVQAAPPLDGAGSVHVRVCVPPPQVDQLDQPPLTADIPQAAVLHASEDTPVHPAPPLLGAGLVQERV